MHEFMIIDRVPNMPWFCMCRKQFVGRVYSTSQWVLTERWAYSETCQKSKTEHFE